MQLTLRTLLAYLDDTLPADQAKIIGEKVAASDIAPELIEKIKKVTRRRGLSTPVTGDAGGASDPNTVADYLSDAMPADQVAGFEQVCLESNTHLAEVAACHQILTLLLTEPVRVPPTARQRMYQLVTGRESLPNRKPGKTVPVAGEMPEEQSPAGNDEADATFLLGLRAYSRKDSLQARGTLLAAAVALVSSLTLAVALAWPRETPTPPVAPEPAAVTIPAPPVGKPSVIPPPAKADPVSPVKVETPAKTDPPAAPPTAANPVTPATPAAFAASAPPRPDRGPVGRLENTDAVLLSRAAGGSWLRATAEEPTVPSADRTLAVPGFKPKVRLDSGTLVELWGNTPELAPLPVLDAAVTFFAPADGFDADIELHGGRVYLTTKQQRGAKVRVRFDGDVWDFALADDKTDVVIERVNSLTRGFTADRPPAVPRRVTVGAAVLRGAAAGGPAGAEPAKLKANEEVTRAGPGQPATAPRPLGKVGGFRDSAYYSRFPLAGNETEAKAAQTALAAFAKRAADRDGAKVALAEMLKLESPMLTLADVMGMRLAAYGQAATGELPPLIDALNDNLRPFLRDAAAYGLAAAFAENPDEIEPFRTRLKEKLGLDEAQTAVAVRLLRGCTDDERKDPAVMDKLFDLLTGTTPVLRELAFAVLKADIDPDARLNKALYTFDAAAPPADREAAAKAWKKRLEDLKKR